MNNLIKSLGKVHNSGQSHSIIICGNIYDLFFDGKDYVPIIPYILSQSKKKDIIQVTYELNGPIRIASGYYELKEAWIQYRKNNMPEDEKNLTEIIKSSLNPKDWEKDLDYYLSSVVGKPAAALELLRNFCICSRKYLKGVNLLILVEGADMIIPNSDDLSKLNDAQLHRIAILQDWIQDPDFIAGGDTLCLLSESSSLIHNRITRLPQVVNLEINSPDLEERQNYINYFSIKNNIPTPNISLITAGLTLYAIRQILLEFQYNGQELNNNIIAQKIEQFIKSQVGEDVVEFKKPEHKLSDCVGFSNLKNFLKEEFIPRVKYGSLSGAAVAGSIGGGKTYIFEAVASELDIPVLVLKNIRSQWYGQTDVIFERLRRVLEALDKVCIFVDEADTQFGKLGGDEQATERRLTGKIQSMMSDPKLKGKIVWLLMTARIHLLSADIRRPGRVGDLIIPILDPDGNDRKEFVKWSFGNHLTEQEVDCFYKLTYNYSAAAYASVRSQVKDIKRFKNKELSFEEIKSILFDIIPAEIELVREYQNLQALINCTRKCLLPDHWRNIEVEALYERKKDWAQRIKELEKMGIS
jgi:hypothetical protein